jgi:raffinose/stachyose/melibiose transport system substrate-binding protein
MTAYTDRRTFLRAGVAGAGALLGGGLLGSCSSSSGRGGDATVTYWTALDGAEVRRYFGKAIVDGFAGAHAGKKVKVVYKNSADLERDVRLALAAGTAPDVVETNGPAFIPELAQQHYLIDLTDYATRFGWKADLLPWVPSVGAVGGRLYSIPTQLETLGIFYNKTLFDQRGYLPPRNRRELETMCEDLKKNGIVPFAAGNRDFAQTIEWFTSVFFSTVAGPQVMHDVLTGKKPWTSEAMVEAADLMQDYFQRGYFGGSPERYFTASFNSVHADLARGKAAMDMEGTWFFAQVDQFFGAKAGNDNDWGFASFPALRDGVPYPLYPIGTGATLSINAKASDPEIAAQFIDYLIGDRKTAAQRMADHSAEFALPLRFTADDFPTSMNQRVRDAYVDLLAATAKGNIGYTNWTFSAPKTAVYIYQKAQKLVTAELTPAKYMAGVEATFQEDLKAGFTPVAIDPGTTGG